MRYENGIWGQLLYIVIVYTKIVVSKAGRHNILGNTIFINEIS
jgi:hypothetical protein